MGRGLSGRSGEVRILLDTHALVWWLYTPSKLSQRAGSMIADPMNEVLASPASAFEIALKYRVGKWPEVAALALGFSEIVAAQRMTIIAVTASHASTAGSLPGAHRDPFDRMLAAQSMLEAAPILTVDLMIGELGATILW